jgi:hypothetical protein
MAEHGFQYVTHFEDGDLMLVWDKSKEKPGMHKKFDSLWIRPYQIQSKCGTNSFVLATPEGEKLSLLVNGYLLKPYFSERT